MADSLLNISINECQNNGFHRIESIKVRIGRASGVIPEALLFTFDTLKAGTIAEGASLVIEEVPVSGHCNMCNADFIVDERFILCCPQCGDNSFTVNSGRELDIQDILLLQGLFFLSALHLSEQPGVFCLELADKLIRTYISAYLRLSSYNIQQNLDYARKITEVQKCNSQ